MISIGIIGSGFGGLAAAIALLESGHTDLRLYERADSIGGVWRDNTYPGAACDVPSALYSFSFAPFTGWTSRYAHQPQILQYLHDVADDYGITDRVQTGRTVTSAVFDEAASQWEVGFADGDSDRVDVLISAVGQLSDPVLPAIPGTDAFEGISFHSARWDHEADLAGKRIAVVGTGASAIQFIPHLARQAAQLHVFQRTPPYILPRPDQRYGRLYQGAFERVRDRALRDKLTPDYPVGCRRILFANSYYPALARPNVHLHTSAVSAVTETGVVTGGKHREVDAIIYGTGFAAQNFLSTIDIRGRGGRALADEWIDGARAYLGVHVPDFPNLFITYGPNTNLGGGSIVYMLEAQARHIRDVLCHLRTTEKRCVAVTNEAAQLYDEQTQRRLDRSVWAHCESWYRHASDRITSNWPGNTRTYSDRTAVLHTEDFTWT